MPTAASSSTTRASSWPATSSPRCSPRRCCARSRARRCSTTFAPRARWPTWSRRARWQRPGQSGGPRLLQDAHARDRRRFRRRGVRPLLLPRLLLRRLGHAPGPAAPRAAVRGGPKLSELLEPLSSRYFISGEINSEVEDQQAKMDELRSATPTASSSGLDGISVDYDDWHSTFAPPTPSRCCASTSSQWCPGSTWSRSATTSSA